MLDYILPGISIAITGFFGWYCAVLGDKNDDLERKYAELLRIRNSEIAEYTRVVRELLDCTNQMDTCTIYECNCI